jgi:protein-S-isoprenylcysteine O-methyltransferase Ste14
MSNTAAIGLILIVLATWIRLMTYRHLGRFYRFEASIQKDHELIVSRPYSVVHHTSYSGGILMAGGLFPWHLSKGSWFMESGSWITMLGRLLIMIYFSAVISIFFFTLARMSKEDITLRNQFGKKWDDWAKRVPYSVIPGIYLLKV